MGPFRLDKRNTAAQKIKELMFSEIIWDVFFDNLGIYLEKLGKEPIEENEREYFEYKVSYDDLEKYLEMKISDYFKLKRLVHKIDKIRVFQNIDYEDLADILDFIVDELDLLKKKVEKLTFFNFKANSS